MALSIVNQIKDTILGVKSNKIDSIIDDSLSKMDRYSAIEDQNKYLESMKRLISQTGSDGNSVLKSLSNGSPQVQQYDNSGRVSRYNEYDSICAKIPYCERALQCWVDHIVSPDEILKNSLQITPVDKETSTTAISRAIGRIKSLVKHFDFENRLREIVKTTLKKGDNFLEFVKTPNGANTLVVLNEGIDPCAFEDSKILLKKDYVLKESNAKGVKTDKKIKVVIEESYSSYSLGGIFSSMGTNVSSLNNPSTNNNITRDISGLVAGMISKDHGSSKSSIDDEFHVDQDQFKSKFDKEEEKARTQDDDVDLTAISDLSLVIHDPKYVIKLETKRYKVCLGYLVFPKVDLINVQSGVVNNIDSMCAQMLNDVKAKLASKVKKSDDINISDDIKKVLLVHLQHIDKNEDLRVRYVNPDLMQHFKLPSTKYDPYGESIFDSVLFNCRLYMAQKTAAVVKQINASTDKRFISLEIGLPRDAKNVIEQLKEQINKKRVTVDSLGNTDTIPSQISTWENIFIPMKDGKKYVEIDHQQWSPSANDDIDQLKNGAGEIVSNLGVPPEYLSIGGESSGNRSTLTAESIQWARQIVARQQDLEPCLYGFFYKAYCLVWGVKNANILKNIRITFQIPRIAPMNINIEYIENSQRAIEALSALGLSKEYLKRQYMPYIDWDKAEQDAIKQKINQETGEEQSEVDMGLGGMGGGMMMPTGGGMGGGMM